jgi:hypothetical protein
VNLTWTDNASNESGFKVERSPNGSSFAQIATTAANATAYVDTGVTANQNYFYRVRGFNAYGNSPYSNTAKVKTPAR